MSLFIMNCLLIINGMETINELFHIGRKVDLEKEFITKHWGPSVFRSLIGGESKED